MKRITSTTNPTVKDIVRLHNVKGRREAQLFIAEGERVIATFLEYGWQPHALYATAKGLETRVGRHYSHAVTTTEVSDAVMQVMSGATTPSGILALFQIPPHKSLEELATPAIALARIADPGNMGTLIRTAAAFNFSIILIEGANCWSPKVVQSSAGALAMQVPFQASWQEELHYKRARGSRLHALVAHGGASPEISTFSTTSVLVVGSEAHGIPEPWLDECDELVTLAMPGHTESLNAAIAGSIGMYVMYQKIRDKG